MKEFRLFNLQKVQQVEFYHHVRLNKTINSMCIDHRPVHNKARSEDENVRFTLVLFSTDIQLEK